MNFEFRDFENILSWFCRIFYTNYLNISKHIIFIEFWILRLWNISYYRGFVEFYKNYLNILLNFCFPGSSPVQPCQGVVPAQPCLGISSHTATAWSFPSPTYIYQTLAKPSGGLRIVAERHPLGRCTRHARHFKGFNSSTLLRVSSDMRSVGWRVTDRVPKVVFRWWMDLHRLSARLSVYCKSMFISKNFRERLRLSFTELLEHHGSSGSMVACCRFTVTVNRLSVAGLQMEIDSLLKLCRSFPSPPPPPPHSHCQQSNVSVSSIPPCLPPQPDPSWPAFSSVRLAQFCSVGSARLSFD